MNMSFGKLLAAGKSWVGGDGIGRYRMQKNIRLPKFISPRNPFKPETTDAVSVLPVVAPELPAVAAVGAGPSANGVSRWACLGARLRRFALFCLDHNPFSHSGQARLPSIPRFGRPGVQGELSLDQVQVVRSDLAHDDLEVVQAGAGGNPAASPAWRNLTTRIFGASLK
jgi:hypothetical protein